MSFFLWAATFGSPSGYFLLSFVAKYRPWRDVFWALLGICGGFWLIMVCTLRETRHSIILLRRAAKERRIRGSNAIDVPESMRQRGPRQLFQVALTRPFRFLATEAIIIFGALYNGYLYGLSFLYNGAFSIIFGEEGHGFDVVGVGLSFLGIMVGISFGPLTNLWQERQYHRSVQNAGGKNIPEARVGLAKLAGVVLPISMFWFAWTSYTSVHWIVPIIASAFWGWSFYTLILMTYMYTVDSYKVRYLLSRDLTSPRPVPLLKPLLNLCEYKYLTHSPGLQCLSARRYRRGAQRRRSRIPPFRHGHVQQIGQSVGRVASCFPFNSPNTDTFHSWKIWAVTPSPITVG